MPGLSDEGRAKVNLTLRVNGRRVDGYHDLESVVAFADCADRLTLTPGPDLDLKMSGPLAQACGETSDNLVLKAARLLAERVPDMKAGSFTLDKVLPVAAGIGGGSADAAAALRLLAQLNGLALDDPRILEVARADRRRRAGVRQLARLRHDRRRRNAGAAQPAENALRDGQSRRSRCDQRRVQGARPAQRRITGRRHRRAAAATAGPTRRHRSKNGSKRSPPAPTIWKRPRLRVQPVIGEVICGAQRDQRRLAGADVRIGRHLLCDLREHRRSRPRGGEDPARSPRMVGACGNAELRFLRRMGRAKRNPSCLAQGFDGFRCALPILRARPPRQRQRNAEAGDEQPRALSQSLKQIRPARETGARRRSHHHHDDIGQLSVVTDGFVGWAKRRRAHHCQQDMRMDVGHGASAPLPTLRFAFDY